MEIRHRNTQVERLAVVAAVLIGGALCLMLVSASKVQADTQIAGPGSGVGQVEDPGGLAFDEESELLYVADSGNNRIDVFTAAGTFVRAFGWGVSNGTAELQTCTVSCQAGIAGGGPGQFASPRSIAVDNDPTSPSHHDVYVFDAGNARVQKLTPTGSFVMAWGGGVITAGAEGTGDVTAGSRTVTSVNTSKKAFLVGQTILGAGIGAGVKIAAVGSGTVTLSKAATATAAGEVLSVAEGTGNIPNNEIQKLGTTPGAYRVRFSTPAPSDSVAETPNESVTPTTTAAQLEGLLEDLSNIGAGDVDVNGPVGGPFEVEFKGSFADTNVNQLETFGSPAPVTTLVNGHSVAAVCTVAVDCVGGSEPGISGSGAGQFGTRSASGAIAVSPDGTVGVGGSQLIDQGESEGRRSRVQAFNEGGTFLSQFTAAEGQGQVVGLAIDASGAFYVGMQGLAPVAGLLKFSSAGTPLGALSTTTTEPVAISASGDIFAGMFPASVSGTGVVPTIEQFDSSGTQLSAFYGSLQSPFGGLAVHSSPAGDVYVSEEDRILVMDLPEPGPIVHPETTKAVEIKSARATFEAAINPEGQASTYHFEYVDDATYQAAAAGHKFDSAQRVPANSGEDPTLPADFDLHRATLEASGLLPETTYHLRALADSDSGTYVGDEGQPFTTKAPLEIAATWAQDVGTDSAILASEINPLESAASGYFQYVDQATFEAEGFQHAISIPDVPAGATALSFGDGNDPVRRTVEITQLNSGRSYRYRTIATNHCTPDPEVLCKFEGPMRAFTTFSVPPPPTACPDNDQFRTGPATRLPDCRAYEMVSPIDKNGGDIKAPVQLTGYPTAMNQSALGGETFTFTSYRSFGAPQGAPFANQYLARRISESGWQSTNLSPPRSHSFFDTNFSIESAYKAFSPELDHAWLLQDSEPTLALGAPTGFANLYRRDNASGSYRALNPTPPPVISSDLFYPELQGVSANGGVAIFKVNDKLAVDASEAGNYQLYVSSGEGQLRLVSVMPDGSTSVGQASAGTNNASPLAGSTRLASVTNALSEDGTRVFWSSKEGTNSIGPGKIYLRLNATQPQSAGIGKCLEADKACTIPVSQKGEIRSGAAESQFEFAAADGSKALFRAIASVTDLYSYDVATNKTDLIAHQVDKAILGASEDANRIYFCSKEILTGANTEGKSPIAGAENLYFYDGTMSGVNRYRYVATLGADDLGDEGSSSIDQTPIYHTGRVSGDGETAIFTSVESPTGYDNADAETGQPAAEVYRYDASADGGVGQLLCLSCNPTGGRPAARHVVRPNGGFLFWAAATLPGGASQLYFPRSLTAGGGRVYFNAYDSLLPTDTNGRADVYQWEAAETGTCDESSPTYSSPNGGCLDLISSGTSPTDSEFLDASESGHDAFFTTGEGLLPQDYGLVDVYDAREGGGFPQPPPSTPRCEGEACLGPASVPASQTAASESYMGPGNSSSGTKRQRCDKHKVRRNDRCVNVGHPKQRKTRHPHRTKKRQASHVRKVFK